ncbi:MAG: hypothetical protein ABEJ73_12490 [Haloplanus sp.]
MTAVAPTRVVAEGVSLAVYDGSELVTSGVAGQRRYPKQGGMQIRDVLIDRGLLTDTYVIAGVSDGTASITIKRIPFVTPMRLAIVALLAGMALVLLFDPRHGALTGAGVREPSRDTNPEVAD